MRNPQLARTWIALAAIAIAVIAAAGVVGWNALHAASSPAPARHCGGRASDGGRLCFSGSLQITGAVAAAGDFVTTPQSVRTSTCAEYAASGARNGSFSVPAALAHYGRPYLYTDFSMFNYHGPRDYSLKELDSINVGVDGKDYYMARPGDGNSGTLTVRPDGSGHLAFTAWHYTGLSDHTNQQITGTVDWTCRPA